MTLENDIIEVLLRTGVSMTSAEIASCLPTSRQTVNYHIPQMIERGYLIPVYHGRPAKYALQPIFLDGKAIKQAQEHILAMVRVFGSTVDLSSVNGEKESVMSKVIRKLYEIPSVDRREVPKIQK